MKCQDKQYYFSRDEKQEIQYKEMAVGSIKISFLEKIFISAKKQTLKAIVYKLLGHVLC